MRTKTCIDCEREKPVSAFTVQGEGWSLRCTACIAVAAEARAQEARKNACARVRAYQKANPEKTAARKRAYNKANREKIAARTRAWRQANPEKVAAYRRGQRDLGKKRATDRARRLANPEKAKANMRAWYQANPGKVKANNAVRRSKKRQRYPAWADREAIASFYAACPPGFDVDHIYPLQGEQCSGLHVLENLQYLPAGINRGKSNNMPTLETHVWPTCLIEPASNRP